ncbi:MAG: substrate-binding domain-containing protein [Planctomycetota bacterium]|jgi:molybdate transport system substrate-binding protein
MKRIILAVTIVAMMLLAGCKGRNSEKADSAKKELLFYCAAGIRPPAAELVETFGREHGVKVIPDYAGSEVLLSKIKLVQRGDLYMPGDKHYIEQAVREDMILSHRPLCYWVPTILVQKGNPKGIRGLEDLLGPGLKLGLGDPDACAIGRISRQIFARNNIAWDDIKKRVVYQSLTVNELGIQIQTESLDAVIVWDAIARYYSEYGDEIPIAPEKNVLSTVDVGVLKFTRHRELAEKFVDFAASERGREIFKKHNYSPKPPE